MKMKQNIILWLGAIVITFLSGYVESVTSSDYPITGTIGVDGKKLSYKLDKAATPEEGLDIILRTDVDSVTGQLEYKVVNSNSDWIKNPLEVSYKTLKINLHIEKDVKQLKYRVRIFTKDRDILIQEKNQPVLLNVKGKVPGMVNTFFYLFLFGGLLFSTRTALDYFNEKEKIKKLSLLTFILFCSSVIIFFPLKKIYEMQSLGSKIIPIAGLVDTPLLIITVVWLAATILVFNIKNYKIIPMIAAIITLILFQINNL